MEIKIIQPDQFAEAARVMDLVAQELWGITLDEVRERDSLADLDDIQGYYLDSGGLFLIVIDHDQVIGTGGIHPVDKDTCELKRLWLLKDYRGQGLGRQLTKMLLANAQHNGYRRVRLEVPTPEKQQPAVALYSELGFQPIPVYGTDGLCALAMEKSLETEL